MSVRIIVAERAINDLREIERYSLENWDEPAANNYLERFETALNLIRENPGILRKKPELSKDLLFYSVAQHLLVFVAVDEIVFLLTVKHGRMDLVDRLSRLEPTLAEEVKLMLKRIKGS